MENWKDIKGYEGFYKISDMGNIHRIVKYSTLNPKPNLKPRLHRGYHNVNLFIKNKPKRFFVHQLVALTLAHKQKAA